MAEDIESIFYQKLVKLVECLVFWDQLAANWEKLNWLVLGWGTLRETVYHNLLRLIDCLVFDQFA